MSSRQLEHHGSQNWRPTGAQLEHHSIDEEAERPGKDIYLTKGNKEQSFSI